jgi:L-rhamnose mutarotase
MRLRAGCAESYIERHRNLPPDMRATLNRAGYRNYTIFRQGDLLVGTFECDDIVRMQRVLAADAAAARWRAAMAELVENNAPDPETGMLPMMIPIFHHAGNEACR